MVNRQVFMESTQPAVEVAEPVNKVAARVPQVEVLVKTRRWRQGLRPKVSLERPAQALPQQPVLAVVAVQVPQVFVVFSTRNIRARRELPVAMAVMGLHSQSVELPDTTAAVVAVVLTTTPNQQLNSAMAVLVVAVTAQMRTVELEHLVLQTLAVAEVVATGKVAAPKVVLELSLFATQQLLRQSTQ